MVTWAVANTTEAADVGKSVEITAVRNWAAQLDDDFPHFFDLNPWEDVVPAGSVPALVSELVVMETRMRQGGFPVGLELIVTTMLRMARRAAALQRALVIN